MPTIETGDGGGNCGLWGPGHAGLRPGQSLSWLKSAHSRSRDLPRRIGGLPGEAVTACGSLRGSGH